MSRAPSGGSSIGPDPFGALVDGAPVHLGGGPDAAGEPLSGLTFVAKDVLDVAGTITGAGNPDWAAAQRPAAEHAAAVSALLGAGAELVGKGQCAELAFSLSGANAHYGMPRNAAAPERDPGGSTSGPAAAVAGGLCDLGIGTDTLGSVRIPASYCGLYAYRPTHGAISTAGVLPLAQPFDTVGVLAREPDVMRRAVEVLLGPAGERRRGDPPRRLLLATDTLAAADPAVAEATRAAGERLATRLEATVAELELSGRAPDPDASLAAFRVLQGVAVWRNFGRWVREAEPALGPDVAARVRRAAGFGPADVADAEPVAAGVADALGRLCADEALLIPAAGAVAPPRDADPHARETARVAAARLSCIASLAGTPAVALPLATVGGLPIGISLVGRPGSDHALLAAAARSAALDPVRV